MEDGPVRALFYQDGRCFAVSGTSLYEITQNHTVILRGTTVADGRPATPAAIRQEEPTAPAPRLLRRAQRQNGRTGITPARPFHDLSSSKA